MRARCRALRCAGAGGCSEAAASEPARDLPAGVTGAAGETAEGGVPGEAAVVLPSPSPLAAIAPCLRLDEARIARPDGGERRARYERAREGAAAAAIALTRADRRCSGGLRSSSLFVVVSDVLAGTSLFSHGEPSPGVEHFVTGFPYGLHDHIKTKKEKTRDYWTTLLI